MKSQLGRQVLEQGDDIPVGRSEEVEAPNVARSPVEQVQRVWLRYVFDEVYNVTGLYLYRNE